MAPPPSAGRNSRRDQYDQNFGPSHMAQPLLDNLRRGFIKLKETVEKCNDEKASKLTHSVLESQLQDTNDWLATKEPIAALAENCLENMLQRVILHEQESEVAKEKKDMIDNAMMTLFPSLHTMINNQVKSLMDQNVALNDQVQKLQGSKREEDLELQNLKARYQNLESKFQDLEARNKELEVLDYTGLERKCQKLEARNIELEALVLNTPRLGFDSGPIEETSDALQQYGDMEFNEEQMYTGLDSAAFDESMTGTGDQRRPSNALYLGTFKGPSAGLSYGPIAGLSPGPTFGTITGPPSRLSAGLSYGPIAGLSPGPSSGPIARLSPEPFSRPIARPSSVPTSGPSSRLTAGPRARGPVIISGNIIRRGKNVNMVEFKFKFLIDGTPKTGLTMTDVDADLGDKIKETIAQFDGAPNMKAGWWTVQTDTNPPMLCMYTRQGRKGKGKSFHPDPEHKTSCQKCMLMGKPCILVLDEDPPVVLPLPEKRRQNVEIGTLGYYILIRTEENSNA